MTHDSTWSTIVAYICAAVATVMGLVKAAGVVALLGLCIGVATFAVNWWHKRKMLALQQAIHDEYMRRKRSETMPAPLAHDA